MFSLQKLFGKEKEFFRLLIKAANEAALCASALHGVLIQPESTDARFVVQNHRLTNKRTCEEIGELLVKSFVTALDREDIESLGAALYKMPKPIVKFAERLQMAHLHIKNVDFQGQATIVQKANEIVVRMINALALGTSVQQIKLLNQQLQQVEADADALENSLLQALYATRTNSIRVVIVKDLHAMLERAVDRARDTGTIVTHIVLKNS